MYIYVSYVKFNKYKIFRELINLKKVYFYALDKVEIKLCGDVSVNTDRTMKNMQNNS